MDTNTKANHFDTGKEGVDQIPAEPLLALGQIYDYGAKKYGRSNWRGGMPWYRLVGSALRHIYKWKMGQDNDDCTKDCEHREAEFCPVHSRLPHLAHALWNIATLYYYQYHGIGEDTRE